MLSCLSIYATESETHVANHQFELKEFRAVASYKLAVYYAGGFENINVNDLWNFSKALNETTNYCEALGVLRELKIRTQIKFR